MGRLPHGCHAGRGSGARLVAQRAGLDAQAAEIATALNGSACATPRSTRADRRRWNRDDFGACRPSCPDRSRARFVTCCSICCIWRGRPSTSPSDRTQAPARRCCPCRSAPGFSSHIPGDGAAAFALADTQAFEGVVSKRGDRPYRTGRSDAGARRGTWHRKISRWWATCRKRGRGGSVRCCGALRSAPRLRYAARRLGLQRRAGARPDRAHRQVRYQQGHVWGRARGTRLRGAAGSRRLFVVEAFHRGISSSGLASPTSLKAVRWTARWRTGRTKPRQPRCDADADADAETAKPAARSEATAMRLSSPKIVYPDRGTPSAMWRLLPKVIDWLCRRSSGVRCRCALPGRTGKACFFQKHHTAECSAVDWCH